VLTVATYLWGDKYGPEDARRLRRMVAKHLSAKHEFAVITDKPHAFDGDKDIRAIPLDMTTHVPNTCFVRLFTFHPQGAEIFGERMLQVDLDTLIVGGIDPLAERDEDLVMWRNPSRIPWRDPKMRGRPYYNTSLLLHRCGTRPKLWEFGRVMSKERPAFRDDQWALSEILGPDQPYFDGNDGIYRLGRPDTPGSGVVGVLPDNAKIVTFPGSEGKWDEPHIRAANPWIDEYLGRAA
jgi:hypothetical protein